MFSSATILCIQSRRGTVLVLLFTILGVTAQGRHQQPAAWAAPADWACSTPLGLLQPGACSTAHAECGQRCTSLKLDSNASRKEKRKKIKLFKLTVE